MTRAEPTMDLRPAQEGDLRPLARLWALAFPGERSVERRVQALTEGGTWGGIETAWVAEREGRLMGAFRAYGMTLHLFGRPFPTLGLAAVAVDPAFRRRGVGAALCRAALRLGRERGDLLSALYPFRVDFYARLGYTLAGELHRYRFRPASLPAFPGSERVQDLPPDERRPAVPAAYRALLPRLHGAVARPEAVWRFLDREETGVWVLHGGEGLQGYMVTTTRPDRRGGGHELRVRELLAGDPDGYRALLGWIAAQRDQWSEVVYDALPGERLHQVLSHPRLAGRPSCRGLWFPSATVLRGPMLRILHLPEVLGRLDFGRGAVLEVADPDLPENSGVWSGAGDGPPIRVQEEPGGGALPIQVVSGLVAEGALPGIGAPRDPEFRPALGIRDFRLLDSF